MGTYIYPTYAYRAPDDLRGAVVQRRPLVIVGAGPVGLAAAIDARLQGLEVLLLDEDDSVSSGSRAVCYAKRTLEILDRLGVGDTVVDQGVCWNVGRTFSREEEVYQFNLVPEAGYKRPGMINLQQYYLEEALVARALALGADLRWKYKVTGVLAQDTFARLTVETPDGPFELEADWLIVADGARSPIRQALGLEVEGRVFKDRFLIADVVMKADFPAERWFWFDPAFHPGQSVLLHKQRDNVWRIDFQLGWDADPLEEKKPERVLPRLQAMLGDERPFELEWISIYTFQCRRMKEFRHGRLLFVGDAAHQVSPFGARGANSGIQDADDLIWKLKLVLSGLAPERLLDTYNQDRTYAADENLLNSTRSTDFITPKSPMSKTFRDATLALAKHHAFARKLVNSGRLSVPSYLTQSSLNTPDLDDFEGDQVPGAPLCDAPVVGKGEAAWLLDYFGHGFQLLVFTDEAELPVALNAPLLAMAGWPVPVQLVQVCAAPVPAASEHAQAVLFDAQGLVAQRYDARTGTCYLIRPDQHVVARWRHFDEGLVQAALARATAQSLKENV